MKEYRNLTGIPGKQSSKILNISLMKLVRNYWNLEEHREMKKDAAKGEKAWQGE